MATTVTFAKALQAVLLVHVEVGSQPAGADGQRRVGHRRGHLYRDQRHRDRLRHHLCVVDVHADQHSLGTCNVTATKAADVNYQAQPSLATAVSMTKAVQANLVVTSTNGSPHLSQLTLTTTPRRRPGARQP